MKIMDNIEIFGDGEYVDKQNKRRERISKTKYVLKKGAKATYEGGKKILRGPSPQTRRRLKIGLGKLARGAQKSGRIAGKGLRSASRGVKKLQVQTKPKDIGRIDANKIFRL